MKVTNPRSLEDLVLMPTEERRAWIKANCLGRSNPPPAQEPISIVERVRRFLRG
jgi:hypothetical protein